MDNEILKKIVTFAIKDAASLQPFSLITGERLYDINRKEAQIISTLMGEMIRELNTTVFKIGEVNREQEELEKGLIRAFIYCFDKTMEIIYCIRTGIDNGFEWDSNDMFNGISGDKIPEYLQLKITPIIPYIGQVYRETWQYSQSFLTETNLKDIFDALLYSAVQVGTEIGLRLDFEDTSEWDRYMEQ